MSHEQLEQGKEKRNHLQNQQPDSPREEKSNEDTKKAVEWILFKCQKNNNNKTELRGKNAQMFPPPRARVMSDVVLRHGQCGLNNITNTSQTYCITHGCIIRDLCLSTFY